MQCKSLHVQLNVIRLALLCSRDVYKRQIIYFVRLIADLQLMFTVDRDYVNFKLGRYINTVFVTSLIDYILLLVSFNEKEVTSKIYRCQLYSVQVLYMYCK